MEEEDQADEEGEGLEEEEGDGENKQVTLAQRRQKKMIKKHMSAQELAANRALRIKMGKSGAQAASRRPVKQGKDACQRKLWNNDVSIIELFQF